MSDAPLASVSQLAAYLKTTLDANDATALLYLKLASGAVRDTVMQDITAVSDDVVYLDPINGSVQLPQLPVTRVSLVETFDGTSWSTAPANTYMVTKRTGTITSRFGLGVSWPCEPESWRVTYDHGFFPVPDGLVGVTLAVAAHGYMSEAAIDSERIGGYQVKYSVREFDSLELRTLARYAVGRLA